MTFEDKQPQNPPNARANFLFGEVRQAIADIHAMKGSQTSNRAGFLSAAKQRQFFANEMRTLMRQIARVAKILPAKEYPGAREKLQVPRSNGYIALLTRAEVYLETFPAIKSAFIERGMPADFDLQLRELMDEFTNASQRKSRARVHQVGSTAGMKARLREAVRAVRELDVILSLLLQNDPALYAGWKSASHIERAPRRSGNAGLGEGENSTVGLAQSAEGSGNVVASDASASGLTAGTQDPGPPSG